MPRQSAGYSCVCPQEYTCEYMHARTKLACAESVFLQLELGLGGKENSEQSQEMS